MPMTKPLRLLSGEGEDSFGFKRKGQINRGRNPIAEDRAPLDLLADRFDAALRAVEEASREVFVFTQKPEQNMFGLDLRGPKLARLLPREENNAARFLGIPFEHTIRLPNPSGVSVQFAHPPGSFQGFRGGSWQIIATSVPGFNQPPTIQSKDTVAGNRKPLIMRHDDRGQMVLALQLTDQIGY